MAHEQFEESVPLYSVGALEREDRLAFEAHLGTGCATCRTALKEYHAVAGLLPYGLSPAAPPPELKRRVLAEAPKTFPQPDQSRAFLRPKPERGGRTRVLLPNLSRWLAHPVMALGAILLLVGVGLYALATRAQVEIERGERQRAEMTLQGELIRLAALQRQVAEQEQMLGSLREEVGHRLGDIGEVRDELTRRAAELDRLRVLLAQKEQDAAGLRKTLAQRDEMLDFLRSPHVKVVSLAGLEGAKSAGALLLFDPGSKKAFFYGFNMPPLPAGKTYQLWAIVDKPVSAGTFGTDAGAKSRLIIRSIPELSRITKFAVSVEPEGGQLQPTGDIYLMGQL